MNIYGFCTPVNGTLNLVDFLVENIQGLCQDLIPARAPNVFITNSPVPGGREGMLMPVSYYLDGLDVTSDEGQQLVLSNVFVFDTDHIWKNFLKIEDSTNLLVALWQTIFHEVRHFVQCQLPVADEHLLSEEAIDQVAKLSSRVAELLRNRLASYSHCEPKIRKGEIDAIVVEALSTANLMCSWGSRCDGEFDYQEVRRVMLMTANQFAEEQLVLTRFRD